ncbi:MAG: AAA family ATPase [Nitrososphaeria archaeon]
MARAVVTGTSGSGRGEYIARAAEAIRASGREVRVFDVGPMMFEAAGNLGIEIPEGKILNLAPSTLNFLRTTVFERILGEARSGAGEGGSHAIVSTHACFRWRRHLLQAFDFYYLNLLSPDVYATVVDSIAGMRRRLEGSPQWRGRLGLKDMLVWRDEETLLTKSIADFQRKPFFVIPAGHPPETLGRLLEDPSAPKAYLSYPMTHVGEGADLADRVRGFASELRRRGLIVFDPGEVEDMEILEEGGPEAESVREDIYDQTVARDYQLIDQSDFVIVYYHSPVMSPGVLSEMAHAFSGAKDVYVVFRGPESPFFRYYSTRIFRDEDELFSFLEERIGGRGRG